MSARSFHQDWFSELDESSARELDALCDRFEADWKAGSARPIEDCIALIADDHRRPFTLVMIALEIQLRQKAGQSPTADEYRQRFAAFESDIEALFLPQTVAKAEPRKVLASLPQPGEQLGDYEILEQFNAGGMGVIYKAWQISVKRLVALKVIALGEAASSTDVARFINEAEAAARLEHPGIVPILGSGSENGRHYLAMALINGPSLAKHVETRPMPAREAAELVRRVAIAVDYAHRQGVIHRDLKPGNILLAPLDGTTDRGRGIWDDSLPGGNAESPLLPLGEGGRRPDEGAAPLDAANRLRVPHPSPLRKGKGEGERPNHGPLPLGKSSRPGSSGRQKTPDAAELAYEPKITDFGLAKLLDSNRDLTRTGDVLGTLEYMPPEQASGQMSNVGASADIYALGAILYRLLTGRTPFYHANPIKLIKQLSENDPVDPRLLAPGLHRDLETICLKCLQKKPSDRFPTAADLAQELHRFLHGEPIHSRPITQWERARKWCQRNPAVASLSAAVVLVLLTGTAVSSFFAFQSEARNRNLKATNLDLEKETKRANAKTDEALTNFKKTQIEKDRADAKVEETRRHLYAAHMNLAQNNWDFTRVGATLELLKRYAPGTRNADLSGFEWHYWDRLCHSNLLDLKGHIDCVCCVALSPDGQHLASGSVDQTAKIWDMTNGQEKFTLRGHHKNVVSVIFSLDGRRIASASDDETVKLWDVATGEHTLTLNGHTGAVTGVSFSPDGKRLVSASQDSKVKVWDTTSGQEMLTLKGHTGSVNGVAFSPDGNRIASAGWDGAVKVWDAATGQETLTLNGHTARVESVSFSADGKRLASASWDRTVKVWDATSGRETLTLRGHMSWVTSVVFSADGKRLATASDDETVKVWDAQNGQEALTLKGHTGLVSGVAISTNGRRLASASLDGTVKVWDATSGHETLGIKAHDSPVLIERILSRPTPFYDVAISADGKWLASASFDGTVKVWDAVSGQETLTLKGHTRGVTSVAFSADGKWLASASQDQTVKMWDAVNGQETRTLRGHTSTVRSVAISTDGKRLVSASQDGTVKLWDATNGQEMLTLKGHTDGVNSVAFSADGKRLASASDDQTVKVWDATNGQEMLTLKGHTGYINDVAFSADGKQLASASWADQAVKLWNATNGQELLTLNGHVDGVTSVAFSPDGKRLASASEDQTVKVWDATTGQEMLTLKGHTDKVTSVAFSADGKRLVSASIDGTVKVWDSRPWTPELRAEREALSLIHFLRAHDKPQSEWLNAITSDQTLSAPVRQRALQFARDWKP